MVCFRVLALVLVQGAAWAAKKKLHGDSIWDPKSVIDESTRVARFREIHGTWPDPKWLETETPGYSARMREREELIMRETDSQKRWDGWMFLAQARLMPTFTPRQWDVAQAPPEVNQKLQERFHRMLADSTLELMGPGLSGVHGPNHARFFPQEELNYEVLWDLQPMFEEWAGVELEPTSVYGVRVYQNGSTLVDHLDVLETHVISGILHIASDLDEPFPIQVSRLPFIVPRSHDFTNRHACGSYPDRGQEWYSGFRGPEARGRDVL